jgi:predicted Fe-Mo cluster-binding NifX family protein
MKNGRVAIPSVGKGGLDGQRSQHFGHCDAFTLIDVENGEIGKVTVINNQEHQEGGCLVPVQTLSNHKVNALVVSGIGLRPLTAFNEVGIDVFHDAICPDIKPVVDTPVRGFGRVTITVKAKADGIPEKTTITEGFVLFFFVFIL